MVHVQHLDLQKEEDSRRFSSVQKPTTKSAKKVSISLRVVDGFVLDSSPLFPIEGGREKEEEKEEEMGVREGGRVAEIGEQCLKFYNCEMYYSEQQIKFLEEGLREASLPDRLLFFQVFLFYFLFFIFYFYFSLFSFLLLPLLFYLFLILFFRRV